MYSKYILFHYHLLKDIEYHSMCYTVGPCSLSILYVKGAKPPEAFGERPRDWSLGHAGDEGPYLSMTGESRGCSRAAAPVCGFSRGTTARSVSLSWP